MVEFGVGASLMDGKTATHIPIHEVPPAKFS